MGRKKKEPAPEEEAGSVLDGISLTQHTAETWAVQFRHQGKPCSKLLYGNKQTAASVRELVAVWLCFKANNAAAVASELQQLQHNYEHYSFLIEALKHSRSVEALWKVVGRFCRGEFEVKSLVKPGQGRASGDENSSPAHGVHHLHAAEGEETAVNSQSNGGDVALDQQQQQQLGISGASMPADATEPSSHQAVSLAAGYMHSMAGGTVLSSHGMVDASSAALAASQMQMLEPASAAAAAAAAAVTGLPGAAGFPVNTAAAAAALQAALMYARSTDPAANMLPFMWQQQLSGMHMPLGYPPSAAAGQYSEPVGEGAAVPETVTAAVVNSGAEEHRVAKANGTEAYPGAAQMTSQIEAAESQGFGAPMPVHNHTPAAVDARFGASIPQQQQQHDQGNQASQRPGQHAQMEEAVYSRSRPPNSDATVTQQGEVVHSAEPSALLSQHHSEEGVTEPQQGFVQHEQHQGGELVSQQPAYDLQSLENAAAAAAAAGSLQIPEELQRQLLAAGGKAMDDAAAQSLLLWWQHAVAGTYPAAPTAAPATAAHSPDASEHVAPPSPKRQRV